MVACLLQMSIMDTGVQKLAKQTCLSPWNLLQAFCISFHYCLSPPKVPGPGWFTLYNRTMQIFSFVGTSKEYSS